MRSARQSTAAPPPPLAESEPVAGHRALDAARDAALRFFPAYIRFLYGRIPAREVPDLSPRFRSTLRQDHGLVTPAERAANPTILHLTLRPAGPPVSVLAVADIEAGRGHYKLTATLEPQHGGWVVVAADD